MSLSEPIIKTFRNVNGDKVNLQLRNGGEKKVMNFILRKNDSIQVGSEFLKFCLFLMICYFLNNLIFTLICGAILIYQCISFATSVVTDTLLVMETVGVQIVSKRRFFGLDTTEFLPWNTVRDIFINEVIIERRVLNYLTFIIDDTSRGGDNVRLVPLFREMKPERKCLEYIYSQLVNNIRLSKKS